MSRAPAVAGKRRPADEYPTPPWVTRRLLEALAPQIEALRPIGTGKNIWGGGLVNASWAPEFLEPCAGRGHIVREVRKAFPGARIESWELNCAAGDAKHEQLHAAGRPGPHAIIVGRNALECGPWPKRDVVIMNPPFSDAERFVELALASGSSIVATLQRVAWATAAKSRSWLRDDPPSLYILPQRPSFAHCCYYGPGKADFLLIPYDEPSPAGTLRRRASADMAEYAWFVWTPARERRVTILPDSSLEERKEGSWRHDRAKIYEAAGEAASEMGLLGGVGVAPEVAQ